MMKGSAHLKVGQSIKVHGMDGVIVKVYPFGTVDVLARNGQYYRVTGLTRYSANRSHPKRRLSMSKANIRARALRRARRAGY